MSAGMAGVIAAHAGYDTHWEGRDGVQVWYVVCDGCDWRQDGENAPDNDHAIHVAEELAKAGYGNVQEASAGSVDLIEHASAWADSLAASPTPTNQNSSYYIHVLVKAIHDRKAEA